MSVLCNAVKFAVGGFSMGAAVALHAAMCYVTGKYANADSFPANLSAAVGLSGWLPCAKYDFFNCNLDGSGSFLLPVWLKGSLCPFQELE